MWRRKSKAERLRDAASEKVSAAADAAKSTSTNPKAPVAGALGLTLLGAAVIRRRRSKTTV